MDHKKKRVAGGRTSKSPQYLKRARKRRYEIESIRPEIIQGSRSQSSLRFGDVAGKQCVANCITFLCNIALDENIAFNKHVIDDILDQGNNLYRTKIQFLLEKNPITYGNGFLSTLDITGKIRVKGHSFNVDLNHTIVGVLGYPTDAHLVDFSTAVHNAFTIDNKIVIICESYSYAACRINQEAVLFFDSHARNCKGYQDVNGTAIIMKFKSVENFADYFPIIAQSTLRSSIGSSNVPIGAFEISVMKVNLAQPSCRVYETNERAHLKEQLSKYFKDQKMKSIENSSIHNTSTNKRFKSMNTGLCTNVKISGITTGHSNKITGIEKRGTQSSITQYFHEETLPSNSALGRRFSLRCKDKSQQDKQIHLQHEERGNILVEEKHSRQLRETRSDNRQDVLSRKQKLKFTRISIPVTKKKCKNDNRSIVLGLTKKDLSNIAKFHKDIKDGCIYICLSCFKFGFRRSVIVIPQKLPKVSIMRLDRCQEFLKRLPHYSVKTHNTDMICRACATYLMKGKMPPCCQLNELYIPEPPDLLKDLTSLETHLITRLVSFMKIMIRVRGAQHGLIGPIAMVPTNINKILHVLPRIDDDLQTLTVELKRRLSDKQPYTAQVISTEHMREAFNFLRQVNEHYRDIEYNDLWKEDSLYIGEKNYNRDDYISSLDVVPNERRIQETQDSLKGENVNLNSNHITENLLKKQIHATNEEINREEIEIDLLTDGTEQIDQLDELRAKRSLTGATMLTSLYGPLPNQDESIEICAPSIKVGEMLQIAPGEGNRPIGYFAEKKWEVLSFPKLFWTGDKSYQYPGQQRKATIKVHDYIKTRLTGADVKFAQCPEYIFQCMNFLDTRAIQNSIHMAGRKSVMKNIPLKDLEETLKMRQLVSDNIIYTTFKNVRATPQYWHDIRLSMCAKVRQLGPYNLFITLSAAEFYWPSIIITIARQVGKKLRTRDVKKMDWPTRKKWLQTNPVTAARMIDFILSKALGNIIMSGNHLIGQVLNQDTRAEFQARGTLHYHIAVHIKDCPILHKDTDEQVLKFCTPKIKCTIPKKNQSRELYKLITTVQKHSCSSKCYRSKQTPCRFYFPKPVSNKYVLQKNVPKEALPILRERATEILQNITEVISIFEKQGKDPKLSDILLGAHVSQEEYDEILKSAYQREQLILKRKSKERYINNYNPYILWSLRANMDIQYICNIWSCIAYVTSYMCKPEKELGIAMKEILKEECNAATSRKSRLLGRLMLTHREVSEHEAIIKCASIPLKRSSRETAWINTGFKDTRPSIILPLAQRNKLDKDTTDYFCVTPIEHYEHRPLQMEDLCLAEYTAFYRRYPKNSKIITSSEQIILYDYTIPLYKYITDDTHSYVLRKRSAIIRYHHVSPRKNKEQYYHRLILLYLPFRDEDSLENNEMSYEQQFEESAKYIRQKMDFFEQYSEQVENAQKEVSENIDIQVLDTFTKQEYNENEHSEEEDEERIHLNSGLQNEDIPGIKKPSKDMYRLAMEQNWVTQETYLSQVSLLNAEQRLLFNYIHDWAKERKHYPLTNGVRVFLSGEGGMGKSFLIETIYQCLLRVFHMHGNDPTKPTVLKLAFTGKAAANINGHTIHSMLPLRIIKKKGGDLYVPPTGERRNYYINYFEKVQFIIIDEISMCGGSTLDSINRVLQDLKNSSKPFGNIGILLVGDLLQLEPVMDSQCFEHPRYQEMSIEPHLPREFKLYELKTIVRQRDDPEFAQMLSRIRVAKHTKEDIQILLNRNTSLDNSPNSIKLFTENAPATVYNHMHLHSLQADIISIDAYTVYIDKDTNTRKKMDDTEENVHKTGNLPRTLQIAKGARILITKNIDVSDNLVNGTTGIIVDYEFPENKHKANGIIYLSLDNKEAGKKRLSKLQGLKKGTVPIGATMSTYTMVSKTNPPCFYDCERIQFPLILAWAITAHKSQGSTYENVTCIFTPRNFEKNGESVSRGIMCRQGQAYTMLSRVKSLHGLHLVDFKPKLIRANKKAIQMMEYLRTYKKLIIRDHCQPVNSKHYVIHLNINGFKQHFQDFLESGWYYKENIYIFTETHLTKQKDWDIYMLSTHKTYHLKANHGICILIPHTLLKHIRISQPHLLDQAEVFIITLQLNNIKLNIIPTYLPPQKNNEAITQYYSFLKQLDTNGSYFIALGDVNIDITNKQYLNFISNHSIRQLIQKPTRNNGHTIDHIYTNIDIKEANTIITPYSDHYAIYCIV